MPITSGELTATYLTCWNVTQANYGHCGSIRRTEKGLVFDWSPGFRCTTEAIKQVADIMAQIEREEENDRHGKNTSRVSNS